MMSIVKQAARSLLRSPTFSLTAVVSVGVGVGLACSVFAIAQAALFPPVPYPDMDRLVEIWPTARPGSDQPVDYLTSERMMEWAASDMRFLEGISGRGMAGPLILRLEEGAERVQSEPIVGDWFGTLGVSAVRGRTLVPTDLVPGAEPAVVVSEALWRNRLSEDPSFPGGTISLTGTTFTVVGIMPSSFDPEEKVWVSAEVLPRRPAAYGGVARLRERVARRQEVEGVAVWRAVIESYPPRPEFDAVLDGPPRSLEAMERLYSYYEVEPGTLEALGVPLVRGRMITEEDGPGSPPIALATRGGAEVWWPGEDPLGHQVKIGQEGTWMTIVGMVEDLESLGVLGRVTATRERTLPLLFTPSRQRLELPVGWITKGDCLSCDGVVIGVRASNATSDAARALREEISDADSDLALLEVGTFLDSQSSGYYRQTILLPGRLATAGVIVALLLAFVGVVGLVAEGVARRTREIGVRVALGASSRQVLATVAREGILTTASGLVVGLVLVVGLHRTLSGTLFNYIALRLGADTLRPSLLAGVSAAIMFVTVAVTLVSSRKALSVDPVEALRSE